MDWYLTAYIDASSYNNSSDTFLGGFTAYISFVFSTRHGELLELLLGVKEIHFHHFMPLVVETDCLVLVQALSSSSLEFFRVEFPSYWPSS